MRTHLASLAVVTALLLAGCSAGGGDSAGVESASADDGAASEPQAEAGGEAAQDGTGTDDQERPSAAEGRSFVVSGSIAVIVEDPREAVGEAAIIVEDTGGFVQERDITAGGQGEPARAFLLVRIPSQDVTRTLLAIEDLGELDHLNETSVEVTEQVVDMAGRVRAKELSIAQLEEVLATSTSVAEIAEAEEMLSARQAELEVLLTEQEALTEVIELATFEVNLWSPGQAPEGPVELEQGFWPSLVRSWDALVGSLGGVLTVLGAILPWAVFFGLIGWGLLAAWRRYQRMAARPGRPGPAVAVGPYGAPGSGPVRFPPGYPAGTPARVAQPGHVPPVQPEQAHPEQVDPEQAQPGRRPAEDAVAGGRPPAATG